MNIIQTLPAKNGGQLQFYRFASAIYCQLTNKDGFVIDDSVHHAHSTAGSWQHALRFAYKFQLNK